MNAPAARNIHVAIADDHPIVRDALRRHLQREEGIEVVAEAASGREAIDLVRTRSVDVLLLDLDMPGQGALDALAMIKARSRNARLAVLVFSEQPEHLYAIPLLRSGAHGYVSKRAQPQEITAAIRHVAKCRPWVSLQLAQLLADELLPPAAEPVHHRLSPRELQIFLKLARGRSTTEVAADLSLSPKTVSGHRAKVMRKMTARSASDLTYYALKHQLIA